ncbi:ABC transporter ATP-binding protein [Candidatus Saccharibacteria bacterium]|nr:ABC transporter ATP-binding protein [Candidatus Saccharibacteria bacterium]
MMPKLYEAIEMAVASGVPNSMLADVLTNLGWPRALVNQAVDSWLENSGRKTIKTDFKTWLKKYQKRARPAIAVVVVISLVQAAVMLLKPWPTKIMADSAFNTIPAPGPLEPYTGKPELIALTAIMSIVLFIIGAAIKWFSDFLLLRIGFWLNRSIKAESFRHILHLPLYHQQRLAKGDYVYRQNVVTNSLSDLVLGTTASIISSIVMIIGVVLIMLSFNKMLTLVSVVLMPLLYLTMRLIGPHMGVYAKQLTEINSNTASAINEAVDNAETVQAFTLESKQLLKVDTLWVAGYKATRKSLIWSSLLENTNSFLVILATSIVMYFGGTAAMRHEMSFGQLLIFMTYMGYLLGPIEGLVKQITSRYQKVIDVGRVYEVLSDHENIEELRSDRLLPPNIRGVIDFQNVSYAYNGRTVFQNLNLHIEEGEKVAIIGPSGGGKSTILKLLPLFITPDSGRIIIDKIDTQAVSLQQLRKRIAWVSQTPQLFSGSIVENVYDGDVYRQINVEEIEHAVRVANVLEFAVKMPMGINSPTGENGGSLSGGQRQRVAIARSLIRNAPILCLDEPTAALDAKSENYIRDSLKEIIADKTVLMVTHRRSLLALMDTIYVLEDGQLRNVMEYGGLDTYLQRLEGVAEASIQKEIKDEQQYIVPELINKYVGLADDVLPAREQVVVEAKGQNRSGEPEYVYMPISDPESIYERRADNTRRYNYDGGNTSEGEEVVIKLH